MKKFLVLIASLLIILIIGSEVGPISHALEQDNYLSLYSSASVYVRNSSFAVQLKGRNIVDMYGLQFTLRYDTAKVSLSSITFRNGYALQAKSEKMNGNIKEITYATLNSQVSKQRIDTLLIADMVFTGTAAGSTEIGINGIKALNSVIDDFDLINANTDYTLQLTISDPIPNPPPTPTPSPSPSPSPTPDPEHVEKVLGFVDRLYDTLLNREPDEEGLHYWKDSLLEGKYTAAMVVEYVILYSPEFLGMEHSFEEFVETCYIALLGRPSDPEGKAFLLGWQIK